MKKYSICVLLACLFISPSFGQQRRLFQQMLECNLDKNAASTTGPSPDYNDLYFWAAHPRKHDPADSIPTFLKKEQRDSLTDVFFIHPTTFGTGIHSEADVAAPDERRKNLLSDLKNAAWNADLSDTALNRLTDRRPILYQASVFNGSCRVFAPRYRQASLKAFLVRQSARAQAAFALAYGDVKKAFQHYLDHENHGRPFIIASHSQGSLHAIRLLQELVDGKPLQKQLVCAYVVGYQIEKNSFRTIPLGNTPTATHCVIGWRTYQQNELPRGIENEQGNSLCVNPLTWTPSSELAPSRLHTGALKGFNELIPHSLSTQVEPQSAILWVSFPNAAENLPKKLKNLHVLDYNLFWMNIRDNVRQRIQTFNNAASR